MVDRNLPVSINSLWHLCRDEFVKLHTDIVGQCERAGVAAGLLFFVGNPRSMFAFFSDLVSIKAAIALKPLR
jgi:hypothetical protein